jgi:hypothetical protein
MTRDDIIDQLRRVAPAVEEISRMLCASVSGEVHAQLGRIVRRSNTAGALILEQLREQLAPHLRKRAKERL